MANGYGCDSVAIGGCRGQAGAALLPAGGTEMIKYTRLGEVLGGGGGGSSPEFSGQVCNSYLETGAGLQVNVVRFVQANLELILCFFRREW